MPPIPGALTKAPVQVTWPDGRVTESVVTWYGAKTRREYRLTRFGKEFPYLDRDNVGSLLVVIPISLERFNAWVLDTDEDIEAVQAGLGVKIAETLAVYERGAAKAPETENECVERRFREIVENLATFPTTRIMSDETAAVMRECLRRFAATNVDDRLLKSIDAEYRLFRMLERKLCSPQVTRPFRDVDEFLDAAQTILQRRKGRAGLSFQNHVERLLSDEGVSFSAQPLLAGRSRPDFILPSREAYEDTRHPRDKVVVLALKTTCRDRWRQVVSEAPLVRRKHILTLQPGISVHQLVEMRAAEVTLVVPKKLQKDYNAKDSGIEILTVADFVARARRLRAPSYSL
jgi:type II restriction enzyme